MNQTRSIKSRSKVGASAILLAMAPLAAACDTVPADPVAAAQAAIAEGAPRIAMEHITNAISADPENMDLRMLAGDLAIALGNPDRAVSEYERVVESPQATSLARAKLAEAYLLGDYTSAAKETLATLTYDVPHAYSAAISIAMSEGDMPAASEKLDEGLAKFPDDPRLITVDAERLWAGADKDAAKKRLAPVLTQSPPVPQAHLLAGQIALTDRDLKLASSHFEKVLSVNPNSQVAILAMAAIARDSGDLEGAAKWIKQSGGKDETHPIGVLFLAQMAFDNGDAQKAFELVEAVPAKIAAEPAFARLRGLIDTARGQFGTAIVALEDYVEEHPGDIAARRALALSYSAQGEAENAWRTIAPAIDNPQADAGTLSLALQISEKTGKGNTSALRQKIEARQSAPDISKEMLAARDAIRAGNWAEADKIYGPLVAGAGKDDPVLLNNAAAVKSRLGKPAEAVSLARRALAKAPNSPIVQDTLGWALWQQGGAEAEARELIGQARRGAPDNREIAEHWAAVNSAS